MMDKKAVSNELIKFMGEVQKRRHAAGDMENYKFNKKRCTLLTENCTEVKESSNGILYWMQRDCRVQDNWAMIFAQRMAYKANIPLYVCFFCKPVKELYPTMRQYRFLIEGLSEVSKELKELNINFYLINDHSSSKLCDIIKENNIGGLICDFNPLKHHRECVETIKHNIPNEIPFLEIDAHNVVPCKEASIKQEIAARTIRSKITKQLDEYLTQFPVIKKHDYVGEHLKIETVTFDKALETNLCFFQNDLADVNWAKPGYKAGMEMLHSFINKRLDDYEKSRNDPSLNAQSNLSPWLHFGHISAQRCALEVKSIRKDKNAESFLEELIVRKELADNYCYYNKEYDNFKGADKWAQITLDLHRKDKRQWVYTLDEFKASKTHDQIWNAAQNQLVKEGKLHGYMRMYWCKKILEWTTTPEESIEVALYLNDIYSLDGSDPNGFVGVMWSICGIHDHGWKERDIFGKIRYMVDYSLEKKFDIVAYCDKYLSNGYTKNVQAKSSKNEDKKRSQPAKQPVGGKKLRRK